jgi:antitoxin ParD1/3/4
MGKNTSILLGDYFEDFISNEVASGKYSSASEVVRTALRLLESEERKIKELRKALVVGEKSGFVKNFDRKEYLEKIHKKFL